MSRLWPHGSIFINNSWLDNPHPVAAHPIYAQGFVFLLDERNPYSEHPEKGKIGPSQLIRGQDRRGVSNANPQMCARGIQDCAELFSALDPQAYPPLKNA
jgi:hypothetical protein